MNELRRMLRYEPESGKFFWLETRRTYVRIGDEAGYCRHRQCDDRWSIKINGKHYLRSRLAWLWMTGEWPAFTIDHIDRNSMNDRWENLREATHSQNRANIGKPRSGNTPRKGVYLAGKKYRAQIGHKGKRIYLGTFHNMEEAHAAYMSAARKLYGEFARAA